MYDYISYVKNNYFKTVPLGMISNERSSIMISDSTPVTRKNNKMVFSLLKTTLTLIALYIMNFFLIKTKVTTISNIYDQHVIIERLSNLLSNGIEEAFKCSIMNSEPTNQ